VKTALVIIVVFDSLGWIFSFIPPLYYAYTHRTFPSLWGIRLLDGGPFGKLGIEVTIIAGILFIVVCAFKLLAAYWLWHSRMDGAVLELILLALSALFWYGFALPFGPPLGIAQVVLMMLLWGSLQ